MVDMNCDVIVLEVPHQRPPTAYATTRDTVVGRALSCDGFSGSGADWSEVEDWLGRDLNACLVIERGELDEHMNRLPVHNLFKSWDRVLEQARSMGWPYDPSFDE
jgi:hypothetical protein